MKSIFAVVAAALLLGAAGHASALPFSIVSGDQVTNINFSGGTTTLTGGGTSLSLTATADSLELAHAGGGTTTYEKLADGLNIALSVNLVLDPSTLDGSDFVGFFNTHSSNWLSSGASVDLSLIDLGAGGASLLEGVIDGSALFAGTSLNSTLTIPFLTQITGGDLDFNLAFGPTGSIATSLTSFSPAFCSPSFSCTSYADFSASTTGNFDPQPGWLPGDGGFTAPEPATLLLTLFGIAAVSRRRRS